LNEAEFERIRDRIDLEASHAADHLLLLQGLVAARDEYHLEMNESNTFWHLTFKAHLDAVVSHLCRLYDKTKGTLSLDKFLRTVKAHPELLQRQHSGNGSTAIRTSIPSSITGLSMPTNWTRNWRACHLPTRSCRVYWNFATKLFHTSTPSE